MFSLSSGPVPARRSRTLPNAPALAAIFLTAAALGVQSCADEPVADPAVDAPEVVSVDLGDGDLSGRSSNGLTFTSALANPLVPGTEFSVDVTTAEEVVRVEYYLFREGGQDQPDPREFLGASSTPPFSVTWDGPNSRIRPAGERSPYERYVAIAVGNDGVVGWAVQDSRAIEVPGAALAFGPQGTQVPVPGEPLVYSPDFVAGDGPRFGGRMFAATNDALIDVELAWRVRGRVEADVEPTNRPLPGATGRFEGFTGISFLTLGEVPGAETAYGLFAPEPGTYQVRLRYSAETPEQLSVSLNGDAVESFDLEQTAAGYTEYFFTEPITVELLEGPNTLTIVNTAPSAARLDALAPALVDERVTPDREPLDIVLGYEARYTDGRREGEVVTGQLDLTGEGEEEGGAYRLNGTLTDENGDVAVVDAEILRDTDRDGDLTDVDGATYFISAQFDSGKQISFNATLGDDQAVIYYKPVLGSNTRSTGRITLLPR